MAFTEGQINFMRADIESGFAYSKLIEVTKERLKQDGRDFDAEFKAWEAEHKREEMARKLK